MKNLTIEPNFREKLILNNLKELAAAKRRIGFGIVSVLITAIWLYLYEAQEGNLLPAYFILLLSIINTAVGIAGYIKAKRQLENIPYEN